MTTRVRRRGVDRGFTTTVAALVLMALGSSAFAQTGLPPADAATPPALQILGFGDVNLVADTNGPEPDTNQFRLGELDLLFLSNLSDSWRVLVDSVVRVEENTFATELERMIVTYAPRDYFELGLGRYNISFGYYSSTYSHNTYFQTAASRPILFEFEDNGGILPEHNTGFTVTGRLPGPLRLRYLIEVGNGQQLRTTEAPAADPTMSNGPGATTPSAGIGESGSDVGHSTDAGQTVRDENRWKALNLGVQVRPSRVPGLQLGANVYYDRLGPRGLPAVREQVVGAFIAYLNEQWEVLAEGARINTRRAGGPRFQSGGFYTQVARQIAGVRPFARYQDVTVPEGEPALGPAFHTRGPSVGLRLDPGPFVTMKFQVDRFRHDDRSAELSFVTQVSFAF